MKSKIIFTMALIAILSVTGCESNKSRKNADEKTCVVRGEQILRYPVELYDVIGGEYSFDDNFNDRNTPPAFKEYAKTLWEKYVEP